MLNVYAMSVLCDNGQGLEDMMSSVRQQMKQLRESVKLDKGLKAEWKHVDYLLENNNKISCYGFFNINNSCYLSTITTILTYQIVMMQFRSTS